MNTDKKPKSVGSLFSSVFICVYLWLIFLSRLVRT